MKNSKQIAIIGGGPAGLMAADVLSADGHRVTLYDAMPSLGRKFLLAGKSGLNITHSEDFVRFLPRFGDASRHLEAALTAFDPHSVRKWAADLGIETFVGSSGRVFPKVMKASPLLRAWLHRLAAQKVEVKTRHQWIGLTASGHLQFLTPAGEITACPDATLLALGGASWPKLGSNAGWTDMLEQAGVAIHPFRPANCGFDVQWSTLFADRFAGHAMKSVTATSAVGTVPGEFVITATGIEGSLVYAHAAALRDQLQATGAANLLLDLAPQRSPEKLAHDLARQDRKASFSNRLRRAAGLEGVKAALLREIIPEAATAGPEQLATLIKALPVPLLCTRPIAEAISSAGGVSWEAIDSNMMLKALPGLFVAGEMIDWEAPTGGYLLTACFATGISAATGIQNWLQSPL